MQTCGSGDSSNFFISSAFSSLLFSFKFQLTYFVSGDIVFKFYSIVLNMYMAKNSSAVLKFEVEYQVKIRCEFV